MFDDGKSWKSTIERAQIDDFEAGKGHSLNLFEKYFSPEIYVSTRGMQINIPTQSSLLSLKAAPENRIWSTSLTGLSDDVINYLNLQREQFIWYWIHSHLESIALLV